MRAFVNKILNQLTPEISYSLDAENLILGTIAQESAYGKYRVQFGNGPAKGICQMESATFNDIVNNYLAYKPGLKKKIMCVSGIDKFSPELLIDNDAVSVCMCRVHYLRVSAPIPSTVEEYAKYWKTYYNTVKGKGTEQEFIQHYRMYVEPDNQ